MKFSRLTFTRNWNNARDFPTVQNDETIVRADMQALHDETCAALNKLAGEVEDFYTGLMQMFDKVTHVVQELGTDHTSIPTSQAVRESIAALEERLRALEDKA